MIRHAIFLIPALIALAGCAALENPAAQPTGVPKPKPQALGVAGHDVRALDQTTAQEKTAARQAGAQVGERQLGKAIVALGSPAESGLWVQTRLVPAITKGRVTTASGKSLAVELRPTTGAALMSLSAYQALGIGLTELPELTVFGP